ncbi:MAG: hypothetical protein Q7V57_18565 [Actinomycetota bacterium]|nr:hypothetical protein [Actinomycetota bacterium]
MDRNEKNKLREAIGEHVDVSNARLSDDEAVFLNDFIEEYDDKFKGQSTTRQVSHDGWSSEGKYTRTEEYTDTFTDDVGIREDYQFHDDDGQSGGSSREIKDARGILNWFKGHS